MNENIRARIEKIKVLICDVDGVLTNGTINIDDSGKELKVFNVYDGLGLVLIKKMGFKTAIISARSTEAVTVRMEDLKIDKVYQDAYPKLSAYQKILKEFTCEDSEVCFMGDDLPDICLLKRVGFAVSVPNGTCEAQNLAHYVTQKKGGEGAVREVVELILKTQGKWDGIVENHMS